MKRQFLGKVFLWVVLFSGFKAFVAPSAGKAQECNVNDYAAFDITYFDPTFIPTKDNSTTFTVTDYCLPPLFAGWNCQIAYDSQGAPHNHWWKIVTTRAGNQVTVTVRSEDCGSYGKIRAACEGPAWAAELQPSNSGKHEPVAI